MDKMTPEQRKFCMSSIHSKNTKPEWIVRKALWKLGFRYRLNFNGLPGHPDLVLKRYRTCIFVNGCFWHGHGVTLQSDNDSEIRADNSMCCRIPKTNREFWLAKIMRNQQRDIEEQKRLAAMGWHCITIWECELKPQKREATLKSLVFTLNKIWLDEHAMIGKPYPELEEEEGMRNVAEK